MPDIRNHTDLDATWSAEQSIPAGTHRIRVWGVDDVTSEPPSRVDLWFRLRSPDGGLAPVLIADTAAWEEVFLGSGFDSDDWSYSVLAPDGTHDAVVELV